LEAGPPSALRHVLRYIVVVTVIVIILSSSRLQILHKKKKSPATVRVAGVKSKDTFPFAHERADERTSSLMFTADCADTNLFVLSNMDGFVRAGTLRNNRRIVSKDIRRIVSLFNERRRHHPSRLYDKGIIVPNTYRSRRHQALRSLTDIPRHVIGLSSLSQDIALSVSRDKTRGVLRLFTGQGNRFLRKTNSRSLVRAPHSSSFGTAPHQRSRASLVGVVRWPRTWDRTSLKTKSTSSLTASSRYRKTPALASRETLPATSCDSSPVRRPLPPSGR